MSSTRFIVYFIGLVFVLPCSCKEDNSILNATTGMALSNAFPRPFAPNCDIEYMAKKLNSRLTQEFFEAYLTWHDGIYKFPNFRNILDRYDNLVELSKQFDESVVNWIEVRLSIDLSYYNLREKNLSLGKLLAQRAIMKSKSMDHISKVDALTSLGYAQYQSLQHEESLKTVDKAFKLLKDTCAEDREKELLFLDVMNFNNISLLDTAIHVLDNLDSLCSEDISCLAFSAHLRGINHYFNNDELGAEKFLSNSIRIHSKDNCVNVYNKSRTYYELANSCHRKNEFQLAYSYYDSAIWFYNSLSIPFDGENKNVYNITLYSGKAELLTDMAIKSGSVQLGQKAFLLFRRIGGLLKETEKFDRDSHIQNQYFHNFYYSYLIKLCAFLGRETQDEKWKRYMLEYLSNYKSSTLSRDLKLNRLWQAHSQDTTSLIYKFVVADRLLESLPSENVHFCLNLERLDNRIKLVEKREEFFRRINLRGLIGEQNENDTSTSKIDKLIQLSKADNVARIFYYVGGDLYNDDLMHVLVIYNAKIKDYIVKDCANLMSKVDTIFSWHKSLSNAHAVEPTIYSKLSNEVYESILLPMISNLDGLEGVHIIPDNSLHSLPFGSLVTSISEDTLDYSQLCYLIDQIDISYGYLVNDRPFESSNIDGDVDNFGMSNTDGIAAFAWSSKQAIIDQPSDEFQELPGSILEIDGLKEAAGSSYSYRDYRGYSASKSNFLSELPQCSIIHLALHATTENSNRNDSKLYFRSDQSIEGLLDFELQYLKLNAELVTLSGCYTNAGKNQEAEGLFSLSRAFYRAGSKRVISNMWALDDRFASSFFTNYYDNLFQYRDYISSISMTKREYLNDCLTAECYPGIWAGLVIHE